MSTYADVFVDSPADTDLHSFAVFAFQLMGIVDFEERESSNYFEGIYFRHKSGELEVAVAYADFADIEGYRFWIPIVVSGGGKLASELAHEYAKRLAEKGHPTFIPTEGWGSKGWDGDGKRYDV